MFDEMDDPTPDLRPAELLPAVQARGRALRRQRQLAATGGVGIAAALVAALVLVLPGGGDRTDTLLVPASALPSTPAETAAPNPLPSVTPAPSTQPQPQPSLPATPTGVPVLPPTRAPSSTPSAPASPTAGRLELRGDDLAVTRIGASRADAVAAVTAVLGPPAEDPSGTTSCVAAAAEVAWPEFGLAFDRAGRLSGWVSRSPDLRTPSGVTVGTTTARLRTVYGERLQVYPANPDNPESYLVDGVDMIGYLSGPAAGDHVVALVNGDCAGP